MPEPATAEVKNPIDAWLDADQAAIDERIEKINPTKPTVTTAPMGETPPEPGPAEPAEPVEPAAEPAEEPVVVAPEGEAPGEVDAAEEPEKGKPTRPRWKDVREQEKRARDSERRNAQLEQEIAFLRGNLSARAEPPPPAAEQLADEPPDPLTTLEQKQQRLEYELAGLRQQASAQQFESRIVNEERAFEVDHPNYKEALTHLVESERRFADVSGELTAGAAFLQRNLREPISINGAVYAPGWIAAVAERSGKSIEDAAREVAFAVYIEGRRARLIASARAAGKPIPQAVMEAAEVYGFSPKGNKAAQPESTRLDPKALKEASASLSNVPNSGPAPRPRSIKTHEDLRALFASMTPTEREKFIDANDAKDPDWMERLG